MHRGRHLAPCVQEQNGKTIRCQDRWKNSRERRNQGIGNGWLVGNRFHDRYRVFMHLLTEGYLLWLNI
jgi:hypothetical protein